MLLYMIQNNKTKLFYYKITKDFVEQKEGKMYVCASTAKAVLTNILNNTDIKDKKYLEIKYFKLISLGSI